MYRQKYFMYIDHVYSSKVELQAFPRIRLLAIMDRKAGSSFNIFTKVIIEINIEFDYNAKLAKIFHKPFSTIFSR